MGVLRSIWLCTLLIAQALAAPPVQVPLNGQSETKVEVAQWPGIAKKRPLTGKFLHITDFHPDRFYKVYTSTAEESACHRGTGPAGIYGAESSDCDSPTGLINRTMEWVEKELKDKVDFVVWTGDSARHDNDEDIPRNEEQVIGLNEFMVEKMFEVFGKNNGDEEDEDPNNDFTIPIIPNMGNNDILPHNILRKGPNPWTRRYSKMWRQFVPEEQKHQFEQGAWFYVEVIRNKLAVFSINTLYFFKSNAAVDGCALPSEPGYEQMEWLRIQLQFLRDRGMKAILTGHVPPAREATKWSWDETCWQKYTLWQRQYRDVIVGSLYGHFNYDHFILQDFKDLKKGAKGGKMPDYDGPNIFDGDVNTAMSSSYFTDLRARWSKYPDPPKSLDWPARTKSQANIDKESSLGIADRFLNILKSKKKKRKEQKFLDKVGGEYAERFAASFVGASVVPNLFPSFRVFEYNITGLEHHDHNDDVQGSPIPSEPASLASIGGQAELQRQKKRYKFEVPKGPSKSSPPGPAYSPQTLTLIRYTQYLANLTHINNDFLGSSSEAHEDFDTSKWNEGKHKGKKPHNKDKTPEPKKFKFQVHYDTKHDDVYQLDDLTMPRLVDLARKVGNFVPEEEIVDESSGEVDADKSSKKKNHKKEKKKKKKKKQRKVNEAWWTFVRRAYVETMNPYELEEQFGS